MTQGASTGAQQRRRQRREPQRGRSPPRGSRDNLGILATTGCLRWPEGAPAHVRPTPAVSHEAAQTPPPALQPHHALDTAPSRAVPRTPSTCSRSPHPIPRDRMISVPCRGPCGAGWHKVPGGEPRRSPSPINQDSQKSGQRPRTCQPFSPRLSPAGQSREHAPVHAPRHAPLGALCKTAPAVSPPSPIVASSAFPAPNHRSPRRHRRGGFSQATGRPRLHQATLGSAFGAACKHSLWADSRARKLGSHCPPNKEWLRLRGVEDAWGWTVLHVRAVHA